MKNVIDVAHRCNPFRTGSQRVRRADPWAAIGTAALRELIERLARSAEDLRSRAAARAWLLDTLAGAPRSDPVYQRMYFALEGVLREIGDAQAELSRRTGAPLHERNPRTKLRICAEKQPLGTRHPALSQGSVRVEAREGQ